MQVAKRRENLVFNKKVIIFANNFLAFVLKV